jgi:hypothetical protein
MVRAFASGIHSFLLANTADHAKLDAGRRPRCIFGRAKPGNLPKGC